MPRAIMLLTLTLTLSAGGCSLLREDRAPERNAALRLEQGLAAFDAGLYADAFDELAWVYSHCPQRVAGHQALTALAALELDPRNESGRPELGTQLLGELTQRAGTPEWIRPMAQTAYLMALALGAPPAGGNGSGGTPAPADGQGVAGDRAQERPLGETGGPPALPAWEAESAPERQEEELAYGCGRVVDRPGWSPDPLPTLAGPSLVALLAQAEARRDALAQRADTLASALEAARQELAETRTELERIRKTLQP